MKNINHPQGKLLWISIFVSSFFMLLGGIFFLLEHYAEMIHFQHFKTASPLFTSLPGMMKDLVSLKSLGFIQFGLFLLYFSQIVRVALIIIEYAEARDRIFVVLSLFILVVLLVGFAKLF